MGSRRAARPSRSNARRRSGPKRRGPALAMGAVAAIAGVGITVAVVSGEDGDASERVVADSANQAPGAQGASGGAAPDASASARARASATASSSPSAKPKHKHKQSASPSPGARKTTVPTSRPLAGTAAKSGGGAVAGGSGGVRPGGSGADSGPGTGSGSGGGPEAQVLALVNKERAAAGCAPLTANERLTRAADDYSDVMARSGVMSHTGPDGSTMTTRIEAAGYEWSTLGENIAQGQADAASVMKSWMNSPGHRANILNCSFKELGVGVHFGDGGPWWTQDFGAGR
ncbi:CAP domain-containing protein [Streptomyces indiaensis]|uniref:CAP domain-containing protein n=1 Tax=Streptomyces indiaensis TaxID=284033 RepID=UPI001F17BA4A|nr:CAP domain-containing protein [Streptomyces indiaensis]MCF1648726.1 CAP domain-containing protein [Streptomyces indiaensis]